MSLFKVARILQANTILFNCDIQQGFIKHIYKSENIINTAKQMAQTANILQLPILVTVQNVKAFGNTVPELEKDLPKNLSQKFEKATFSMINEQTQAFLDQHKERKTAILYGAEAHVCVQQTCLDLLEKEYQVFLLTDGITSINPIDRSTAFQRMQQAGAHLTTYQSAVFEMLKSFKHAEFKNYCQFLNQVQMNKTD
ncbi:isochorismatase family protein, putative [Ichthyophthirius multifiliis]|uniref:Isochorismatase family protein, putative n=1 Tax=Ichthyophthirius multifiliis TaxID=5932 RepID=G0R2E1_ICHMU|nr:isochorismatase family protein, putative [Ichthyophthirius multifiliis]EGR28360.1 isochorismatase family protein, putative [Ichthyophthirius multifiliis]|eukprot:XP_004027705.1 isochorismatase family protein, putative [Ichthyophthirius multifiliis]